MCLTEQPFLTLTIQLKSCICRGRHHGT